MNEQPITAEDLTLYALNSLDGNAVARIDLLLRSSSEARNELSLIRGDLAALGLSAPQHTPPALSRQRLLKQVAREQRAIPIPLSVQAESPFALDAPAVVDPQANSGVWARPPLTAEERRSRVRLPRVVAEPEPMFSADEDRREAPLAERPTANGEAVRTRGTSQMPAARASSPEQETQPALIETASQGPEPRLGRQVNDTTAGRLWQMPAFSEQTPAMEAEDRYTPSSPTVYPIDGHRRSRAGVVMTWAGWTVAAGLAASTVLAVRRDVSLQDQLRTQRTALESVKSHATRAELALKTMESPASQRFVLARQDTAPVPSARVAYLPEQGSLVFQGTSLEPLPAYKTYELWLIPKGEGAQPIPAGTFKPDAHGYASLVMPALGSGMVAGNFGVTIEDEVGATSPTLPILLIGQQS